MRLANAECYRLAAISDTHGRVDNRLYELYTDVDMLLHAGDIGRGDLLEELKPIAPVAAVAGNVDGFSIREAPLVRRIEAHPWRIGIMHIALEAGTPNRDAREFIEQDELDILVYGHTHQPRLHAWNGTLLINPGSCGPKRFDLPISAARITLRAPSDGARKDPLAPDQVQVDFIDLGKTPGAPLPIRRETGVS